MSTVNTPLDRLKRMTAWEQVPKLTVDDLEALLEQYAIVDADGYTPSEVEWVPTYNLRSAARQGWLIKKGRAAELTSTDLDGNRMSANQVFEHCKEMVRSYAGTASPLMSNVSSE